MDTCKKLVNETAECECDICTRVKILILKFMGVIPSGEDEETNEEGGE